ncbi:hypothetical protein GCAAIG_08115 [Candidatus Electronema halotolerans]
MNRPYVWLRLYFAAELLLKGSKVFSVIIIIVIGSENSLTIMSSLNNVVRSVWKYHSG